MPQDGMRLAELVGGLSMACDLADGFAPGQVMRSTVVAMTIGRQHGLSGPDLHDLYWTTLFRYLGCTGFAHEEAHVYGAGNDIAVRRTMSLADPAQPGFSVRRIGRGVGLSGSLAQGLRAVARLLGDGAAFGRHARAQCDTSVRLARLVGLSERVCDALLQICERWDGKGEPSRLAEQSIDVVARVSIAAQTLEWTASELGIDAGLMQLRRRAGGQLDPAVVRTIDRDPAPVTAALACAQPFEDFLAAEPAPHALADDGRIDDVAQAFAHLADLKSCFTLGHSSGVAAAAVAAAPAFGLDDAATRLLRRAALFHDLGRVAVPNVVWDKPGAFGTLDREQARLHAYFTERILCQAASLRPVAEVAAAAHERLDGRGYHRALPANAIGGAARLLAAADVFAALREPRPHRAALSVRDASRVLRDAARDGALDAAAVRALLDACCGAAPRRAPWPSGLSDREVEVLRLVARGGTNKEIARATGLSPKTVQHHVAHVYAKIGVQSRAGAALFATESGLLAGP